MFQRETGPVKSFFPMVYRLFHDYTIGCYASVFERPFGLIVGAKTKTGARMLSAPVSVRQI